MGVSSLFRRKTSDDRSLSTDRAAIGLGGVDNGPLIDSLLTSRRHCEILTSTEDGAFGDQALALSWLALEDEMAMVPGCELAATEGTEAQTGSPREIAGYYLDRFTVTNADYSRFVNDGGYGQVESCPQEIWPNVLQFVDSTGHTGPRFWIDGKPPKHRGDHPAVGVCWYEANAYVKWVGKRLPVAAEWQHASSWCTGKDGRDGNARYTWGDSFDPTRCNTWFRGPGETVPVDSHYAGCTPNGVYQLAGNVWEWVATQYSCGTAEQDVQIQFKQPMAEIRGGAFDTYFERQATCQFRTGQPFLYRGRNVGFRCCVSVTALAPPPDPSAFL